MNKTTTPIEFLEKELNIKGEIEHDFLFYYKYTCKNKIFNVKEIKKIVNKWVELGFCVITNTSPDDFTLGVAFLFEENELETKTPDQFFFQDETNYISFIKYV